MRLVASIVLLILLQASTLHAEDVNSRFDLEDIFISIILPNIDCGSIALYRVEGGDDLTPLQTIPVDQATCKSLIASGEEAEPHGGIHVVNAITWHARASSLCAKLLEARNLHQTADVDWVCGFGMPGKDQPMFDKLYQSTVQSKLPAFVLDGAICTELPTKDVKTASNAAAFAPILEILPPGSEWPAVKALLDQNGFKIFPGRAPDTEAASDGMMRAVMSEHPAHIFPEWWIIYAGDRAEGPFEAEHRKNPNGGTPGPNGRYAAKPDKGLCLMWEFGI